MFMAELVNFVEDIINKSGVRIDSFNKFSSNRAPYFFVVKSPGEISYIFSLYLFFEEPHQTFIRGIKFDF